MEGAEAAHRPADQADLLRRDVALLEERQQPVDDHRAGVLTIGTLVPVGRAAVGHRDLERRCPGRDGRGEVLGEAEAGTQEGLDVVPVGVQRDDQGEWARDPGRSRQGPPGRSTQSRRGDEAAARDRAGLDVRHATRAPVEAQLPLEPGSPRQDALLDADAPGRADGEGRRSAQEQGTAAEHPPRMSAGCQGGPVPVDDGSRRAAGAGRSEG
ncbi:hypothetical protein NPS01_08310 [Nocardioides psychrotolerans]|nr:hypothetical protein NPS01_08310 [Nocardioides psychrotolerans]